MLGIERRAPISLCALAARDVHRSVLSDMKMRSCLIPSDEDDPWLLSFNVEGRAIPAAHLTDEWEKARVEYSVERYNLDFPPLVDK